MRNVFFFSLLLAPSPSNSLPERPISSALPSIDSPFPPPNPPPPPLSFFPSLFFLLSRLARRPGERERERGRCVCVCGERKFRAKEVRLRRGLRESVQRSTLGGRIVAGPTLVNRHRRRLVSGLGCQPGRRRNGEASRRTGEFCDLDVPDRSRLVTVLPAHRALAVKFSRP